MSKKRPTTSPSIMFEDFAVPTAVTKKPTKTEIDTPTQSPEDLLAKDLSTSPQPGDKECT